MPDPKHHANRINSVACALITVSDTRTADTDTSGALLRERLEASGHRILSREILPDEPNRVRDRLLTLCSNGACHAVLLTGGTGLAPRDMTYEAVTDALEKRLDGFGELFRMLSYQQVGPAAMLSRATAGVCRSTLVFSIPGSPSAVNLALEHLILPEIGHLAWLVCGDSERGNSTTTATPDT